MDVDGDDHGSDESTDKIKEGNEEPEEGKVEDEAEAKMVLLRPSIHAPPTTWSSLCIALTQATRTHLRTRR